MPSGHGGLGGDSVTHNQGAVTRDEDLCVQAASTVKPRILKSGPETAKKNFKVPVGGQHPRAATNSEYPSSGVLTEVMDVPPVPSSPP